MAMESPKVLSSAVLLAVFSTLTACGESDIELCNMAYDEADYSNAMEYCQRSRAISQPDALYIMGRILTEGLGGIEIKRDEGLDYLYRFLFVPGLSFSDYPYASDVLRELSNDGDFLGRHPDKAKKIINLFEKVIDNPEFRNSQNYRALANLYINGWGGTEPDYAKAWQYLDEASKMKDLDAMYYQVAMFMNGMVDKSPENISRFKELVASRSRSGVASVDELREYAVALLDSREKDTDTEYGLTVLRELAGDNDGESAYILGSYDLEKNDLPGAKKWLNKASELGIAAATIKLSDVMYAEKQYNGAFNLISKAAESGDPMAQFKVALIYLGKTSYGSDVPVDYARGIEYLNRIASVDPETVGRNSYEYEALVSGRRALASIYTYGAFDQPKDVKKAEALLLPLSDSDADSAGELGDIYAMDESELHDNSKALQMFEKSVTSGLAENNLIVGSMYLHGLGTSPNFEKAHRIFTHVADEGNIDAYNDLGNIYLNGLGVEKNLEKAEELYIKSAENGNHASLYNMSVLKASTGDYLSAYVWSSAYASCGYDNVVSKLRYYYGKVDKSQQKKAYELANETVAKYGCEPKKNAKKWWLNPK